MRLAYFAGLIMILVSLGILKEPRTIEIDGHLMDYHAYCDKLGIACRYCAVWFVVNGLCHSILWSCVASRAKHEINRIWCKYFLILSVNMFLDAVLSLRGVNPKYINSIEIGYSIVCTIGLFYHLRKHKKCQQKNGSSKL